MKALCTPMFWAIHFYIYKVWGNLFLFFVFEWLFSQHFQRHMSVHVLSFVNSNLPQCLPYPRSVFEDGYPMSHFFQTPGYNNQSCWYCKCQFPNFCCCSLGQELVVAIADFALETVLVFFASKRLSPTTFLSLANKNTTLQDQHKHN